MEEKPLKSEKKRKFKPQPFSGKSWKELQDIWPPNVRISSEAHAMITVMMPASISTQIFLRNLLPEGLKKVRFSFREICLLFLVLRCQETRDDAGANRMWIEKAIDSKKRALTFTKLNSLFKIGLIEKYPGHVDVFRLTGLGMTVAKHYVGAMERAHRDIQTFAETEPPEASDKINYYLFLYNEQR